MASTFHFATLLHPLLPAAFFAEYWQKKPLHQRRDATFYEPLVSGGDLERILSSGDLRFPAVQLARHGGYFPPEVYTRTVKHGTEVWAGVPDMEKVQSELLTGCISQTGMTMPHLSRLWRS